MGWEADRWAHNLTTPLPPAQRWILVKAAYSCLDDDGLLKRSRPWLADKCGFSLRSLERHLPQLEKLGLLVWNGEGFRLPMYLEASGRVPVHRQIGGDAAKSAADLSAKLRKEKESTKEKESIGSESSDKQGRGAPQSNSNELAAAGAWNQAVAHGWRYHREFGWECDTPALDPVIHAAVDAAGGWPRLLALRKNSRDLPFMRQDFMRLWMEVGRVVAPT